jgi:hypothetical protein
MLLVASCKMVIPKERLQLQIKTSHGIQPSHSDIGFEFTALNKKLKGGVDYFYTRTAIS